MTQKQWDNVAVAAVTVHVYGMRARGFSLACQPMDGLIEAAEDQTGKYYNILRYSRQLDGHEVDTYELDYIGPETFEISKREGDATGGRPVWRNRHIPDIEVI